MQNSTLEGFCLSPQQKYLWTLQQLDSALPYRVRCAVLIEGNLNQEILNKALQEVVNRHEILRTTFQCLPGMTIPLQVINDYCTISIYSHDLTEIPEEEQESKTEFLLHEISEQPFDFATDTPLYASLVTWSAEKHILILSLSAMNADSCTLLNLIREISSLYLACSQGKELEDTPIQYADIAEWQYELLNSEDTAIGKEYWQKIDLKKLANIKLPGELKSAQALEFKPKVLESKISSEVSDQILSTAEKYNNTYSVILLTCWQILIWKLTQQTEIITGIACNGRKYEELELALGLLSKNLPLHCCLTAELKFNQLLLQVEKLVNDAEKWQEYFYWENLANLDKPNEVLPFLPICFEFKEGLNKYCEADISFSIYKQYACTTKFKLKLSCLQTEDSINVDFYYDSSLFTAVDIKRIAAYFETLLLYVVNHPDAAIGELEILSDRDRHQLLLDFNNTQADYPQNQCIHQLFAEQAELTPDEIAVVVENQQLTYRELNERANQLAHYLQKLGVKPEVIVGICLERSPEMVIAMLGILKAGGAYLPLDAAMPAERLGLMLEDAQVQTLLTQQHLVQLLSDRTPQVIRLDTDWDIIAQESHQNCPSVTTSENLAYVIYTSGSTGTPKGVAVEHQQLLNYLNGILPRLNLPSGASFANVSTFAADLGNTVIFSSLCTGGCLHIIPQECAADADALAAYCRRYSIDCLKIVPSHLAALLASGNGESILPRQCLILGGEAASWDLIEQVQKSAANCRILNHYGPTETTVGVLTYQVDSGNWRDISATIPLGRPIANTQIYILDSHFQPVPMGVAGELYIGGNNLARGYLNRPELTAEKFITNPFIKAEEKHLYKTGDLARFLPDGNIEFLGRVDNQVKIRGFRIELGEIAATLRQHPDIEQAVVIAWETTPGDKRLVAYIATNLKSKTQNPKLALRDFLKQKLPDYMIPSTFITLKTLPLTPNGKLDYQALPAPDKAHLQGIFVAPRNAVEETLAAIWAEVLKVQQVGIYDNFFELGGHSLLATQVISRLRQAFQIELPLHHLFESLTIADLSLVITKKIAEQTEEEILAQMVAELEQLSEEEAQNLLANQPS